MIKPRTALFRGHSLCFLATITGIVGCTDLEFVESNQCGNLVVESAAGEDCDGEAGCGAPGTQHECRFICDDDARTCPTQSGYQCGTDLVCRRSSGKLEPLESRSIVAVRDLLVGDINADGCSEIVLSALRSTTLTAYASNFSESCTSAEQTITTNRPDSSGSTLPRPALLDLTPDDDTDYLSLLSSTRSLYGDGLSLHFTTGASTVFPVLFPRFQRKASAVRSVTINFRGQQAILLLEQAEGAAKGDVTLIADPKEKLATLPGVLNGKVDDIEMLVAGDVDIDFGNPPPIESRCDEVILARRGSANLEVFNVCGQMPLGFASLSTVQLVGTTIREKNPVMVAADLNGDDCLDLAANAQTANLYVSYGTCNGKFQSLPGPPMPIPDQKAQAFNDPAATEATKTDRIFVAIEANDQHPGREIYPVACPSSTPFNSPKCAPVDAGCMAVVSDIDYDGRDDVIATEGQNVDVVVHRQVAPGTFNVSFLSTSCPPQYLGVGDFDSDGIRDIAFFDQTSKGPQDNTTSLSVAYGNPFSAPNAPIAAGRFDQAKALSVLTSNLPGTGSLLGITRGIGENNSASAVGIVEIGNERSVVAPYYLSTESMGAQALDARTLVTTVAGLFGQDPNGASSGALAVLTNTAAGTSELWLVDADEQAGSLRNVTQTMEADIPCNDGCILVAYPQSNGRDKLLMLGKNSIARYDASSGGFTKTNSFNSNYSFSSLLETSNPAKYTPRPVVGDLNSDNLIDVLALATTGELVALYGQADGSFTEELLVSAPACAGNEGCGNLSATQINLDGDVALELIVVGPERLVVFDVDESKNTLVDVSTTYADLLPIPSNNTDYTAISAADIDGDGVSDVALVSSSNFLDVLRGRPEHE